MAEVASAYVTLLPSAKGFARGIQGEIGGDLRRAGKQGGQDYGNGMKTGIAGIATKVFAPLAVAAAALGIGKILSDSIGAGSDLQQALGGADAVFKKDAASIKRNAESAALSLGLPKAAYLQLATVLGAGLKNKGVKDFTGATEDLIVVGADLAAQFGGSTQDAVDALASAMRGESDPIERYGISLNETAVNSQLVAMGAKKVNGKFTEQQKTMARLALITKQSADAQGTFARESDTYAGSQQRLAAQWENIKTQIGTSLLPALTKLSGWFVDKGLPALQAFFDALTGNAKPLGMVQKGFEGMARAGTVLRDAFVKVRDVVSTFFANLTGTADKTRMVKEGLSGVARAGATLRDVFTKAWAALKSFGTYVRDELWPALKDGWETVRPGLEKAGNIIQSAFGGESGASMKDFGTFVTDKLIPGIAQFVNVWLPVMATQLGVVVAVVKHLYAGFEALRDLQVRVASAVIGAFIKVTTVMAAAFEVLSTVPGFGWAKDAADKLHGISQTAGDVKTALDKIPNSKTVTITAKVSMPGRITLPDGSKVNVGMRAAGGPVKAGSPYIVGEKGPELIVPKYHGNVIPNHDLGSGKGLPSASSGIDYYRLADVMSDAMRQTPLAVGVSETTTAVNRRNAVRARG